MLYPLQLDNAENANIQSPTLEKPVLITNPEEPIVSRTKNARLSAIKQSKTNSQNTQSLIQRKLVKKKSNNNFFTIVY